MEGKILCFMYYHKNYVYIYPERNGSIRPFLFRLYLPNKKIVSKGKLLRNYEKIQFINIAGSWREGKTSKIILEKDYFLRILIYSLKYYVFQERCKMIEDIMSTVVVRYEKD